MGRRGRVEECEVVAVHAELVGGHEHITEVELADGSREPSAHVIGRIARHEAHYFMRARPGKLLVHITQCPDCAVKVLAA